MADFVAILAEISGSSFTSIDTLTEVKLLGGQQNPMQGRVQKRCKGHNVLVTQNKFVSGYNEMVKRRLSQEGKDPRDFVLSPRTWGSRVPELPLVVHTKNEQVQYYFEVIFMKAGEVEYLLDGQSISQEDIQGLPNKQEAEQGGLENKVIIRDYKISSIERIRINHAEFEGPWEIML